MKLYIEIENGEPKNHPAFEENLIQAFGNIPRNWEPFIRNSKPTLDVYQVCESDVPTYIKVNDVWTDVWHVRNMTDAEKLEKQQDVKNAWANEVTAETSSWVFDEKSCKYVAPVQEPNVGPNKKLILVGSNWEIIDV